MTVHLVAALTSAAAASEDPLVREFLFDEAAWADFFIASEDETLPKVGCDCYSCYRATDALNLAKDILSDSSTIEP